MTTSTTTAFDVTMPQLGETVSEGTVIEWLVPAGGTVAAGEPLLEVSTDKVDSELPSPATGTVTEILAAAGETVPVGEVIARIAVEEGTEAPAASAEATNPSKPSSGAATVVTPPEHSTPRPSVTLVPGTRLRASPVARRLAAERRIDLSSVVGTGPAGAVVQRDILRSSPDRGSSAMSPFMASSQSLTLIEASVQVDVGAIADPEAHYPIAAYVIRAIVDTLRATYRHHDGLGSLVEPRITYVDAPTGRAIDLPDAAGLRLVGLAARLDPSVPAVEPNPTDGSVTVLDCTALDCTIRGAMSAALTVSIGPPETIPILSTGERGVAITFRDVCRLSIGADGSVVSVPALGAVAHGVKTAIETRNWTAEG